MKKRTLIILIILLLALLIPTGAAFAGAPFDTTVQSGETHNDDIVILDGDLDVEAGATVNGDITVFSGNATIAGTVNGDVVLFDGDLEAATTAVITGECVIVSGKITDNTASGLNCTNFEKLGELPPNAIPPITPPNINFPNINIDVGEPAGAVGFFGKVGGAIFRSLVLGLIAFAVVTLFPNHFKHVENTVHEKPVASGTVGFLTSLAVPVLLLLASPILAILVLACGLGVILTAAIVLGIVGAVAFGWFAVGDLLGQRIADRLNLKNRTLPVTTAVGTVALTLGLGLVGATPLAFISGLAVFIIGCVGLGSVVLTKYGTRAYPPLITDSIQILDDPANNEKVAEAIKTLPDDSDTLT